MNRYDPAIEDFQCEAAEYYGPEFQLHATRALRALERHSASASQAA